MTQASSPLAASTNRQNEQMFPTLSPAQLARIARHGKTRKVQAGEILIEQGGRTVRFFVVTEGQLEIVRPVGATEQVIVVHSPVQFLGQLNMLSDRRSIVRSAVREPGQ